MKFISDLAHRLLTIVHPKKVANCVAESLLSGVGASSCAVAVKLQHIGMVCSAFSRDEDGDCEVFHKERFSRWLSLLPSQVAFRTDDRSEFYLGGDSHSFEYVAPIHIDGQVKGAVVVGFAEEDECTPEVRRVIDAVTQMTAMSINLTSHYEATLNSSITQAKEEHRKFTEAVLDTLPVSLYVIDRDYNIVMWNRHREIGIQGMPRDEVIGRNVFEVLAKYPKGKLSRDSVGATIRCRRPASRSLPGSNSSS